MEKETILVFNPKIARNLIKNGFTVVDIKPLKEDKERTVFIFKRSDLLLKELYKK